MCVDAFDSSTGDGLHEETWWIRRGAGHRYAHLRLFALVACVLVDSVSCCNDIACIPLTPRGMLVCSTLDVSLNASLYHASRLGRDAMFCHMHNCMSCEWLRRLFPRIDVSCQDVQQPHIN